MLKLVRKYQPGGNLLDINAMMADVKNDPRNVRKNGSLTRKGRNELEAIDQIRANQDAGHRYIIDDANSTFKLVDKTGADVENGLGHGLSTTEDDFTLFRKGKIRKEISERMSEASKYTAKPVDVKPTAEVKVEADKAPITTEEKIEEPKAEKPKVEDPKAIMAEQKFLNKTLGLSLPVDGVADERFYTARELYHTKTKNENKPAVVAKPAVITSEEKSAANAGKESGDYSHPGNPGAKYTKDGNGKWHILKNKTLIPITDPARIARLEKDATTYSQAKEDINKSKTEKKVEPVVETENIKSEVKEDNRPSTEAKVSARPDIKKTEKTESITDDLVSGINILKNKISEVIASYETPADKKVIISDEEGKRLDAKMKAQELQDKKDWDAKQAKKLQEELAGQKVEMTVIQKNNKIAADKATESNARKELAAKKAKEAERLKKESVAKEAEELKELQGRVKTLKMKEEVTKSLKKPRKPTDIEIEGEKFKKLKSNISKLKLTSEEVKIYNNGNRDQIIALGKKHNIKFEKGGRLIPKFQAGPGANAVDYLKKSLTLVPKVNKAPVNLTAENYLEPNIYNFGNVTGYDIPYLKTKPTQLFKLPEQEIIIPKNDYPGFVLGEQERVRKEKEKRFRDTTNKGTNTGAGLSIAGSVLQTALPLAAIGFQVLNARKNYKNPIVAKNVLEKAGQVFHPNVAAINLGSPEILNQQQKVITEAGRIKDMNSDPQLAMLNRNIRNSAVSNLKAQNLAERAANYINDKNRFNTEMNQQARTFVDEFNLRNEIANKNKFRAAEIENANAARKAEALSNWRDVQGAAVGNIAKIFGDNLQYNRDVASGLEDIKYQRDYTRLKDLYDTAKDNYKIMQYDLKLNPNAYTAEEIKKASDELAAHKTNLEALTTAPIQAPTLRSWLSSRKTV